MKQRPLRDRYAALPVLRQREETVTVAGTTWVRRLRLVRDDGFKHPLLRVEDFRVRLPGGDFLVRQSAMVADHVILRPAPGQNPATGGLPVSRQLRSSGLLLLALPEADLDSVPNAVRALAVEGLAAEPDHLVHLAATPNDTSFASQWGLHNTGQDGGVVDADVDAPEAWDIHTGSSLPLVAVLDTGVDTNHLDLAANLWTNPGEIPGNGVDDDSNGFVDDVRGWNFVADTNEPFDDNGHGTHCAGIIAAGGNNGRGVSGICWQASLMPLKFMNAAGNGTSADAAEALAYATAMGVHITSNSWTSNEYSAAIENAIQASNTAGILFVAAAGNEGVSLDVVPTYPAQYPTANILAVAATTRRDGLALFSNYSATHVDLAAPGETILSTLPGNSYGERNGTSMAAPVVTGICALMKSYRPVLTHQQIRDLVLASVDPVAELSGKVATGGRVNAHTAVSACNDILVTPTGGLTVSGTAGGPFTPSSIVFTLTNHRSTATSWNAAANRAWINLSSTSGTLSAGSSVSVTASLNPVLVAGLLPADHLATVSFTSQATQRVINRTVALTALPAPVLSSNLDTDPGWTRSGQWSYGRPQGQGGVSHGRPDPTSGATGQNVFGIQLNGDYSVAVGAAEYLTVGPVSLAGYHGSRLKYKRWLNTDIQHWVYATVEVSTNGQTWTPLWDNGSTTRTTDASWTSLEHALGAAVDGQSQVYFRWGHRVQQDNSYAHSGWNLDDIELIAVPDRQVRLTMPAAVTEGGASGTARLTLAPAQGSNTTFMLASNRPGQEATFPATVTVPAGQEEVTFAVSAINDTLTDGTQSVNLTASSSGWPSHTAALTVHDNESGSLVLTLPAQLTEGQGTVTGQATVALSAPAAANITISLASSDTSELIVPASVTIPAGQTSASITLTVPDDLLIDGAQQASVTAVVVNWPVRTATVEILDNEDRVLGVTLPDSISEGAGYLVGAGSVNVSGILTSPLTVFLSSSDTSEATVPVLVVVPAGSSSVAFDIAAVDDTEGDGPRQVQITASCPNYVSGSALMSVQDDELPAMVGTPSPANGSAQNHPETDLAWSIVPDSGGPPETFDVYFGLQQESLALVGNVATTTVALPRLAPGSTCYWRVDSRRGEQVRTGVVWSFTVAPMGPAAYLGWDPLPTEVSRGGSFYARVTAYDTWGNVVTNHTRPATLSAVRSQEPTTTGTGSYPLVFPLASYYHDARSQAIYTPGEVGPAGQLVSLALNLTSSSSQTLNNFTIRLKHTARANYNSDISWEETGWTTVFSQNVTPAGGGWLTFQFTTPFEYDGVSNLMVDFSFNNSTYSTDSNCLCTITTTNRLLAFRSDSQFGDPLWWSGTSPYGSAYSVVPNLRLGRTQASVAMSPGVTGNFVNGTWSGQVTVEQVMSGVRLQAVDTQSPGVAGISSLLSVIESSNFSFHAEPAFTGGLTNTVSWQVSPGADDYEVERALRSDFSDAVSSGVVAGTSYEFTGLEDGRTYYYRGRIRTGGVPGLWSLPVQSVQDATPPAITMLPGSGGVALKNFIQLLGTGQDASGVSIVSLDGNAVSSGTQYATWSKPVLNLVEGPNTFTVTASDQAVPPNVRTEQWTVNYLPNPTADPDGNGVPVLLEYAFNATGPTPPRLLTVAGLPHPVTQKKHLVLSYRRLLVNTSSFQYNLETSNNLVNWTAAGSQAQIIAVEPTGDGVTETVTVRLSPAIGEGSARFTRVRVTTPY